MATKVKPSRLNVTGTPQAGQVPVYTNQDNFEWKDNGNIFGPNSSTDGDIVVFDGTTGKLIKDSGKKPSDYQEKLTTQTVYTAKGTSSKVPQITTNNLGQVITITEVDISYPSQVSDTAYASSWDGVTDVAPSKNAVYDAGFVVGPASSTDGDVVLFDGTSGKLIKDSGVTLGTAASKDTGTSSGNVPVLDSNGKLNKSTLPGVALTDTFTVSTSSDLTSLSSAEQGDLAIVTTESKTYVLSAEPYSTAANWKEILSPTGGVTSVNSQTGVVTLDADDISDSTTTNKFVTASDKTTWSGKQDALTLPATPTQGNLVTWGANNKTLVDGGAIPSTSDCVKTSGDQTIAGTKTFSTSPVVPNKTSDATNTGTAIATEAQVYKKADASEVNTKTFYLSSTSDLTTAQAAYDWYVAGKNALIVLDDKTYIFTTVINGVGVVFTSSDISSSIVGNTYSRSEQPYLLLSISSDVVTAITASSNNSIDYLSPSVTYSTPYTPQYDGSPATKKYVDDKVDDTAYAASWDGDTTHAPSKNSVYDKIESLNQVPSGGNNGDVLTNVSGTATWTAPSGGDVVVSSQTGNILTSGTKLWAGTEADYGNLGTYDQNTIYLTI